MNGEAEVWVLPDKRQVLCTEYPGPPAEICGYVSPAAEQAHQIRGGLPTVSEIGFPADCYVGAFPIGSPFGWGQAGEIAEAKAKELGFTVHYEGALCDPDEEDDAELHLFEPTIGYEDWMDEGE